MEYLAIEALDFMPFKNYKMRKKETLPVLCTKNCATKHMLIS